MKQIHKRSNAREHRGNKKQWQWKTLTVGVDWLGVGTQLYDLTKIEKYRDRSKPNISFLNNEKGVFIIISRSKPIDQFSKYSRSYLYQISKSSVFLLFIWSNPVIPGRTLSLLKYLSLKYLLSSTNNGRGPTIDMLPNMTLKNWGNSSRLYFLIFLAPFNNLGSSSILNKGPFWVFKSFKSLLSSFNKSENNQDYHTDDPFHHFNNLGSAYGGYVPMAVNHSWSHPNY